MRSWTEKINTEITNEICTRNMPKERGTRLGERELKNSIYKSSKFTMQGALTLQPTVPSNPMEVDKKKK